MRLLACLIVAPQRGYDEPAILSYAISSFCPTSADGLQAPRVFPLPFLSHTQSPIRVNARSFRGQLPGARPIAEYPALQPSHKGVCCGMGLFFALSARFILSKTLY